MKKCDGSEMRKEREEKERSERGSGELFPHCRFVDRLGALQGLKLDLPRLREFTQDMRNLV